MKLFKLFSLVLVQNTVQILIYWKFQTTSRLLRKVCNLNTLGLQDCFWYSGSCHSFKAFALNCRPSGNCPSPHLPLSTMVFLKAQLSVQLYLPCTYWCYTTLSPFKPRKPWFSITYYWLAFMMFSVERLTITSSWMTVRQRQWWSVVFEFWVNQQVRHSKFKHLKYQESGGYYWF